MCVDLSIVCEKKAKKADCKNWMAVCDRKPTTDVLIKGGAPSTMWANFLNTTTGVLFSQGLFRPCRRKAFTLCILCINSGKPGKFDLYFSQYYLLTTSKTADTVTSNRYLIISSHASVLNTTAPGHIKEVTLAHQEQN